MPITPSTVSTAHPYAHTLQRFDITPGKGSEKQGLIKQGLLFSLPTLAKKHPGISRLPISLRVVLESLLRHCDGQRVTPAHVAALARWQPNAKRSAELPFVVSRVVLQDFTGVPLLADLAAMRNAALRLGLDPQRIEPLVPVDLVVDHSVVVDHYGTPQALDLNMRLEFKRNEERYRFMKWGMGAFSTFGVVPPGFGIVHQVNLEYLARGVHKQAAPAWADATSASSAMGADAKPAKPPKPAKPLKLVYPDTLVGTDSHTTMVGGIGVLGWGVGGIEAEAAMLGQPVYLLTPDVVGLELTGQLREGVTATDLVLTVTELLRREKVVGKFVEFCGVGTRSLSVPDRATIANMAPEYGATVGYFAVDDKTLQYFAGTGRTTAEISTLEAYCKAQGLFGVPLAQDIDYSQLLQLDLASVQPSLAGPKRPQDRINLGDVAGGFAQLFSASAAGNGFNQPAAALHTTRHTASGLALSPGDVLIAAITSCTNTSNASVMLAAGLLAKKAVKAGLTVQKHIKTSLAPGSRTVTHYLQKAGLLPYLEQLGFNVAAYGCTTCIGNAGDLTPEINATIAANQMVCAAVLSGNRNFEARIHPNLKANYLASPPLVVAYALAGTVQRDLMTQPVGQGTGGRDVYLGDIWPTGAEVNALMAHAMDGKAFRKNYKQVKNNPGKLWEKIKVNADGAVTTDPHVYPWPSSTYMAEPPFFTGFALQPPALVPGVQNARVMALLGDSITTDHISPAGSFGASTPAGQYLQSLGVLPADFNSYGARRGNHHVMLRGTFANVRIKNHMLPLQASGSPAEGGYTLHQPSGERLSIYEAAMRYAEKGTPTVVFAGEEYGTGSSRDWAAKGTALLGIKAVVARSFERIHRSNLIGMGVLPLQFKAGVSWQSLGLVGDEVVSVVLADDIKPLADAQLHITDRNGKRTTVPVTLRIDTPIEVAYYRHGGILPFVLRQLLAA
jgi:aconitate hydratase